MKNGLLLFVLLVGVSCAAPQGGPGMPGGTGNEGVLPTHEAYRIYVVDRTGWDALSLYLYGTADNLGGAWPGIRMSGTVTVKGQQYKYFNVPLDAYGNTENLIFNNAGGGKQIPSAGEPSVTFGTNADFFFTVTSSGAEAFDGGSTYTVDVPSGPVEAAAQELVSVAASARDNWQLYQVNPKLYGGSGAFGKIKDRLDEIKALGTDILYLMPVYEQGKVKAIGSPYCVRDYKAVNTSYGTLEDLRGLVDAAHAKGMKVMFDWVANHTAWDCSWTSEHSDWYAKDASGNIVCPTADGTWSDVAQLDYRNEALWKGMTDALLFWVKELDIDGYRCDYAHGPTGRNVGPMDGFWKSAIQALRKEKPGLIMLAESDFPKMYEDGFDIIFGRSGKSRLVNVFGGSGWNTFFSTYKGALEAEEAPKCPLYFVTNHDDATESTPLADFRGKEGALAAFVLMRSLNTATMIYGSQEVAYPDKINFFNTLTMDWGANAAYKQAYKTAMQALGKIDRNAAMKAYGAGTVGMVSYENGANVLVNAGSKTVKVALPEGLSGAAVRDLVSGSQETLPAVLEMGPYAYRILQK